MDSDVDMDPDVSDLIHVRSLEHLSKQSFRFYDFMRC